MRVYIMRVYISGRIKDYTEHREHFMEADHALRVQDVFEVVNPITLPHSANSTYEDFMRRDIAALLDCDAIYMLEGWERSVGARTEHLVAAVCGLTILYEPHGSFVPSTASFPVEA